MVSKQEAAKIVAQNGFQPRALRGGFFEAGSDSGVSLADGQTGEIGFVEVGDSSGRLGSYAVVNVGRKPDDQIRTDKGKAWMYAEDDAGNEIDDSVSIEVIVRNRGERDGPTVFGPVDYGELKTNPSSPEGKYLAEPAKPRARAPQILAIHATNESGSATNIDWSTVQMKLPAGAARY